MQYIQLTPQVAAQVPTPDSGSLNFFLDIANNYINIKTDNNEVISSPTFYITGGTYSNSELTLTDSNGETITVTGFTGTIITGGTYSNSELILTDNNGETITITGITSGGQSVISVTDSELYDKIINNELIPSTVYKITGFNKNMPIGGLENPNGFLPEVLYDDGTDSGVTIYMKALTTNTLSSSGWGEFYNPKYGDQTTYENTDGTGLYGIWDGDNPDPLEVPEYTVDQVVFWGGYAWKNLIGNVGTAENVITLNSDDWEKLPYSNTTYYELVIDEVKVDWNNGIVIGRTNIENQITVEFNADQYWWWMGLYREIQTNPISVMGWGLYSKITPEQLDNDFYGISNLRIINSNCETVNFKGAGVLNIDMDSSYFNNNYIGKGSYIDEIIMRIFSSITNNILTSNSYIYINTLTSGGIESNTLTNNSYIQFNTLTNSYIQFNTLTNSYVNYNTLDNGYINNSTLDNNSSIYSNTLTSSGIQFNTLDNSYIQSNTLTDSFFSFNSSGTLTSKTLQKIYARDVTLNENISAATDIFLNVEKNIYTRLDGTKRLSYFNNSDVPTIVNVNA